MNRRPFLRALAAFVGASLPGIALAQTKPLRIGLTAVILADQAAFLSRWSAYLGARIGRIVLFVARDSYQSIIDLLLAGELDAAWICGYPYVRYERHLHLLAVPLYRGEPLYQSYLIRREPQAPQYPPIRTWSDVRGKVFAYSDPLSNSGWLVAQHELASARVAARDFKRFFFAHGHRNVAEAVAAGLADAGSIDGYVWETMRLQHMSATAHTDVVWRSAPHGFPPLVIPRGAHRATSNALQRALLDMSGDATGGTLLRALNLDGFVSGTPKLFDSIRRLAKSIPGSGVTA